MDSVISLKVFPLSMLGKNGDVVPIEPDEYEHREGFFPSRQIRVRINDKDVHIAVVDEVPKRKRGGNNSGGSDPTDGTKDNKFLPYCERPEGIFIEYNRKTRTLFMNRPNWRTKECWLGFHHAGDGICKNAEKIYERLRRIAISLATVFVDGHCDVNTSAEVTGPEADPRYSDLEPLDFPLNQVLMDIFDNDPGIQELRAKIRKERGEQISQPEENPAEKIAV